MNPIGMGFDPHDWRNLVLVLRGFMPGAFPEYTIYDPTQTSTTMDRGEVPCVPEAKCIK